MNEISIPEKITHQMQPTGNSCSSACLAMILDLPAQEIINDFHQDYFDGKTRPFNYLSKVREISNIRRCYSDEWLDGDSWGVFLAVVPSLNLEGITHSVVFDCRDYLIVLDPNKGKPNKKYYTFDQKEVEDNDLAVMLRGYILEVEFDGDIK